MEFTELGIEFEAYGIGTALKRHKLKVPPNQRSYAWESDHVSDLLKDLSAAFAREKHPYFLGTIVLTRSSDEKDERREVADGQQRLATTSLLIAAIRDYLYTRDPEAAAKYSSDFLLEYDPFVSDSVPKLRLNTQDNEYFLRAILSKPDSSDRQSAFASPKWSSNERLRDAAQAAEEFVGKLVAPHSEREGRLLLLEWVRFLEERVAVIVIKTTGQVDAYKMFETLNDRGLKASQIDILKNYLFSQVIVRKAEVEAAWLSMVSKIESHDAEILLDYVRHFWISKNGPLKSTELAASLITSTAGERPALETVMELDNTANDYLALLTSLQAPGLTKYGQETRNNIYVVASLLEIEQIRPLWLAILRSFEIEEARKAFALLLSWSVRFLVAGGGGGGVLDRHYGLRAQDITAGVVKTTKILAEAMSTVVPNDTEFQVAFERLRVTKAKLARYYLRCLEKWRRNDPAPHLAEFEAPETQDNLEHIMPGTAAASWGMQPEVVNAYYKRLGNMCLLGAKQNVAIGNHPYADRVAVYEASPSLTTQDVALFSRTAWGPEEIEKRQKELAKSAPLIWKI